MSVLRVRRMPVENMDIVHVILVIVQLMKQYLLEWEQEIFFIVRKYNFIHPQF